MFQGEIRSYTHDSRKKLCVAFNAKTFIASAVKKKVVENMNTVKQAKYNGDEVESYIISTIDKYFGKAPVSDVTILAPSAEKLSFLKSITKRAKNANNNLPDPALQVSSTSRTRRKLMNPESTK